MGVSAYVQMCIFKQAALLCWFNTGMFLYTLKDNYVFKVFFYKEIHRNLQ